MTNFKEYANFDGLGLGDLVNRGEVSAEELLEAAIKQAQEVNPRLNAIIHRFDDRARRQIQEGLPEGPFKGVPFLLKDLLGLFAGEPITMGSRGIHFVPDYDTELVKRFKATGVNIFGKTNTPEFGLIITTEPKAHGPTHNPHKQGYSTGGSSGGSAAAVAAGIVPMASAGDGGGSIRLPSGWCGVFGLKPSRGRNPSGPDIGEEWEGAVAEHVITRSVRDSAAMLDLTAGAEAGAPYRVQSPKGLFLDAANTDPKPLRIAVSRKPLVDTTVDAQVLTALDKTVQQLEDLGHHVEEADPDISTDMLWRVFVTIVCSHVATLSRNIKTQFGAKAVHQFEAGTKQLAMVGRSFSAVDLVLAKQGWHQIQYTMGQFLTQYDVLLTPTTHTPAVKLGVLPPKPWEELIILAIHRLNIGKLLLHSGVLEIVSKPIMEKMAFMMMGNITGLPGMSVPLHKSSEGLPIGMQFTGRMCDEETLFSLAGQLERAQLFQM